MDRDLVTTPHPTDDRPTNSSTDSLTGDGRRAIDEAAKRWSGGARVIGYPGRPSANHPSMARAGRRRSGPAGATRSTPSSQRAKPAGRIRRRDLPDGMTSLEFVVPSEDAEQLLRVLQADPGRNGPASRTNGGHGRWPGGGGRSA
ncbi:MAG: hypothetical protein S0880_27425 [Actinomycetota bacterium]|nr:hypothetical protein [Actinomycetota bacterium]